MKDLKREGCVPNCTGSVACFSRLSVLTRPRLRLRSAQPSRLQGSRSRFQWRKGRKHPTQNTAAIKRAGQENVEADYLFANFLQHSAFRSTDKKANLNRRVGPIRERLFSPAVSEIDYRSGHSLTQL